jgi:hypothetical protein
VEYFYTRNDDLLRSKINKTFPELLTCSDSKFDEWVDELCVAIAYRWDVLGIPPHSGLSLESLGSEFKRLVNTDCSGMFTLDEQTRSLDIVADSARVSAANQFFPNIQKAKDSVGQGLAISVYDLYTAPDSRTRIKAVLHKALRRDGFYSYSPVYRVPPGFRGDLRREAVRFVKECPNDKGFWLEQTGKNEQRTPRLRGKELKALSNSGSISKKHLNGIILSDISDDDLFRIRIFPTGEKAEKVLPSVFRCVQLSGISTPNNFPAGIARLLYRYATERCREQDEIVIYDPSMGFGGRLLGALSLRDRAIHYIGTDPNTENWIPELGISRYEYMQKVFQSHVRSGPDFKGTYLCCGSEEVAQQEVFKQYKGKVDFIFTSPPYFAAEIYSEEATQSAVKYRTYEAWRDEFLRPTLETCAVWLRNQRNMAFNIADVNINSTQYPLERDTVEILNQCGLQHIGTLKMLLAVSPNHQVSKLTRQPTTKNFCLVNGKWRKYEPIFVFYKP